VNGTNTTTLSIQNQGNLFYRLKRLGQ